MNRPDTWVLNAIVLQHVQRFAVAASQATRATHARAGSLLNLVGSLTWAASPFGGGSREQEAGLALMGALLGAVGPDAAVNTAAPSPLAALEREFHAQHDQVLAYVEEALAKGGALSPAQLNARVWELLFPQLPYGTSLDELADALEATLTQGGASS